MGKLNREERLIILDELNDLFDMDRTGWPVDDLIRNCGDRLGSDEINRFSPPNMTEEEFQHYQELAKKKGIPDKVLKDRLRANMDPHKAATMPYLPYNKRNNPEGVDWRMTAAKNGISYSTYRRRLDLGWSEKKAATHPVQNQKNKRKIQN